MNEHKLWFRNRQVKRKLSSWTFLEKNPDVLKKIKFEILLALSFSFIEKIGQKSVQTRLGL